MLNISGKVPPVCNWLDHPSGGLWRNAERGDDFLRTCVARAYLVYPYTYTHRTLSNYDGWFKVPSRRARADGA